MRLGSCCGGGARVCMCWDGRGVCGGGRSELEWVGIGRNKGFSDTDPIFSAVTLKSSIDIFATSIRSEGFDMGPIMVKEEFVKAGEPRHKIGLLSTQVVPHIARHVIH